MQLKREKALWAYERMVLIRKFEDKVHDLFSAGKIPGFVHLYAGGEAVAVGVCAHFRDDDFLTSTHRGHGHCIAKGVDVRGMMAELFGKATGSCKGKGGSMHIADIEKGMLGANGIVGGGAPLACGPALMARVKKTDQVTACFFGDGGASQGTVHEALNLASIWKLPVIFVCENNLYAQTSPVKYTLNVKNVADRAASYGVPGVIADGMSFFDVYEKAGEAVRRARAGEGPTLIEAKTYRFYGHFEGDAVSYRPKDEEQAYRKRDPITDFKQKVLAEKLLKADELEKIEKETQVEVDAALEFAESSQFPKLEEILTDVYVNYP